MARKNKTCAGCGQSRKHSIEERYHYTESGLDNVYLENVEIISCACGYALVLWQLPTLLRIIATCFAYKPSRLYGSELRFLRHVVGAKAAQYAEQLSIRPEHLSRLENSPKSLAETLDKLVRARIILDLVTAHPELASGFDLDKFQAAISTRLPVDDGMALFVKYEGSHLKDEHDGPIEFEFRDLQKAA